MVRLCFVPIFVLAMAGYSNANNDAREVEYTKIKPRGFNYEEEKPPIIQRKQNITIAHRLGPEDEFENIVVHGDGINGYTDTTKKLIFTINFEHIATGRTIEFEQGIKWNECNNNLNTNMQCKTDYVPVILYVNRKYKKYEVAVECICNP